MRIISGSARGRGLHTLGGGQGAANRIRPTSDRAREAVFNIIGQERVQGARVLDLFAGTGALGLEAMSRGGDLAVFVDQYQPAIALIHKNAEWCGVAPACIVLKRDLGKGLRFLRSLRNKAAMGVEEPEGLFDLVFLDPPYEQVQALFFLNELQRHGLLAREALVVFEDRARVVLPEKAGELILSDRRKYGDTGFWFYTARV